MRRRDWSAAAVAAAALCWCGCGYVGEPLPPALHIPQPVAGLAASQTGARVVVRFTLPGLTTEGVGLRIVDVELRAGTGEPWPGGADRFTVAPLEPGPRVVELPAGPWAGKRIQVAVRVQSHKGRWSAWSPAAVVDVVEALASPAEFRAAAAPGGVRLTWKPPREGQEVRVFRRLSDAEPWAEAARVGGGEWVDPDSRLDAEHQYQAETVAAVESGEAISDRTAVARLLYRDEFPPAVPSGVSAVPGLGSIELAWDRPPDADLAGFRIYRAVGGGEFERLGEQLAAAAYGDRAVKTGVAYRYAVTSVDARGNESALSAVVEATAP